MSYNQLFIEALREGYPTSIFTESELKFVTSKELIEVKRDRFWPKFVGEFTTPENSYFSLPKNFQSTVENVELIKKVLQNYKDLKGTDGKTLLTNNNFAVSQDGQLKSEKFFYNELKEFFLDYITYEYIYPSKQKKIHSTSPVTGGKVDVFSTMKTRKQKGPGITYKVKDIQNNENWNLDDIYWSTINELSKKYSTDDDRKQISEMRNFLEDQGYKFKTIDISDKHRMIKEINKCDVGIIHQSIKNTLIDYFKSRMIGEKFSLNLFYTTNFEKVWEELSKKALYHNEEFKDELKTEKNTDGTNKFKFSKIETISKWFPKSQIDSKLTELSKKGAKISEDNPLIIEWQERSLEPDIFSWVSIGQKDISFLGDAKYYNEPDSEYSKEMNDYNEAVNNKFPMCIFCCSENTNVSRSRRTGNKELIIFLLSTQECINVAINRLNGREDYSLLRKVHKLIEKYTRRKGSDYLGGF